ncbi:hypothetical protein [Pseudomonas tremae]|uniref:hypothetical protein n=1 Tax=Pseudomonas tremae TaxID=200454 RepID=UPI001F4017D4|nr:hypothetical protein [Pseudomonas tremae]
MGSSQKLHCAQVGQFSTGRVGQFCIGTDSYENGMVSFDIDALVREASLKGSYKTGERIIELVSAGLNLQALAKTPLRIPMVGKEPISIRL